MTSYGSTSSFLRQQQDEMNLAETAPLLSDDKGPMSYSSADYDDYQEEEEEDSNSNNQEKNISSTTFFYPPKNLKEDNSINECCPKCCTIFSLLGMIFMIYLGFYASFSICYTHNCWTDDEVLTVQTNAFGSCGMYFITFLISLYFWGKQVTEEAKRLESRAINKNRRRDLRE